MISVRDRMFCISSNADTSARIVDSDPKSTSANVPHFTNTGFVSTVDSIAIHAIAPFETHGLAAADITTSLSNITTIIANASGISVDSFASREEEASAVVSGNIHPKARRSPWPYVYGGLAGIFIISASYYVFNYLRTQATRKMLLERRAVLENESFACRGEKSISFDLRASIDEIVVPACRFPCQQDTLAVVHANRASHYTASTISTLGHQETLTHLISLFPIPTAGRQPLSAPEAHQTLPSYSTATSTKIHGELSTIEATSTPARASQYFEMADDKFWGWLQARPDFDALLTIA